MSENRINLDRIPDHLKAEVSKYLKDPKRYIKLHPVCYKLILPYLKIK